MEKKILNPIPTIKTLLILILVVLSIFLAAQLWLVQFTSQSFVPYVQARFAPTVPEDASQLVRPFRIVTGAGDGYFTAKYSGIETSPIWGQGQEIIGEVLENGTFVQVHSMYNQEILNHPIAIFQYAFCMDTEIFAPAIGRSGAILTDRNIHNFRSIGVLPPKEGNTTTIFFICTGYMWEFTVTPSANRAQDLYISIPSAANLQRRYTAAPDGIHFVMELDRHFTYHPALAINPYVNNAGFLHLSFIGQQVSHFFDNPATINPGVSAATQIYTFSNLRTVVRYHPWNVLEYSSFRTIGRTGPTSLVSDFSAAFAFVRNDPNVVNEFYLAGYETRGRETVFWFNYVIDNFPLVLPEPWHTGPECQSPLIYPIEVVVDHGRVVRYRKIVYNFVIDPSITASPHSNLLGENLAFHIGQPGEHIRLRPVAGGDD